MYGIARNTATTRADRSFKSLEFNPIQSVNDRAEGNGEQLEAEVLADLSENDLTDDNGCKTDHDGTAACVDIRKALILGI